ncbi:ATPase terminase subunit, putative, partial [uncultured Caudovirales phage]
MANYSEAIKEQAKLMYFNCAPVSEIMKQLNINSVQIIYKWINDNAWDKLPSPENAKIKTSVRYNFLLEKDDKTANDLHELE